MKNISLKNKTALVTGAGKGIGKACAIALAQAGADLIIISRTKKDLLGVQKIISYKRNVHFFECDLFNIASVFKKLEKLIFLSTMQEQIVQRILLKLKEKIWIT